MKTITEKTLFGADVSPVGAGSEYAKRRKENTNSKDDIRRFGMLLNRCQPLADVVENREVIIMNNNAYDGSVRKSLYTIIQTPERTCTAFCIDTLDDLGWGRLEQVARMIHRDIQEMFTNKIVYSSDNDATNTILQARERTLPELGELVIA